MLSTTGAYQGRLLAQQPDSTVILRSANHVHTRRVELTVQHMHLDQVSAIKLKGGLCRCNASVHKGMAKSQI